MESSNGEYVYKGTGLFGQEKRWGHERFNEYRSNYLHLHKMGDLSTLEDLIYQQALHERLKKKLSKKSQPQNPDEAVEPIAPHYQKQLADNLELQSKLKDELGLREDKKTIDAFKDFEDLNEKFAQYRRENADLFATTCPKCAFTYYLKRRTKDYEPLKSVWFKDKVLFNHALFKVYKEQHLLTKKDMAEILGVSEQYIDWMEERFPANNESSEDSADLPSNTEPQPPQE